MILHLDPTTHTVSRSSRSPGTSSSPTPAPTGPTRSTPPSTEGPSQLVAAIEEDFGIPIQHYVELNFDSFANVVNALGGIKMYFPEPVFDAYSGLNIPTPGCHHLDGVQALQVVRARHLQYKAPGQSPPTTPAYWPQEAQSDLARIRRDHEFLRVLATAVRQRGLCQPDHRPAARRRRRLASSTVDSGFSASAHGRPGPHLPRGQHQPVPRS